MSYIPVAYDTAAEAPRFCQFLDEIFAPDADREEKKHLLLEALGYSLWPFSDYEKFFLMIGVKSSNGKSRLINLLQALAGRENVSAVEPGQFCNRFQLAHIHGKLINAVTELPPGASIADSDLKKIVSGELITAEHKGKPPFEFRPFCTVWIGTNHMPKMSDFSPALFRRAVVIPFNREFLEHEQDVNLDSKLRAELPGVLRMALSALGEVFRRGAFSKPPSCELAKDEWRTDSDEVRQFIEECCTTDNTSEIPSGVLYDLFKSWSLDAGIKNPLDKRVFGKRIQAIGAKSKRGAKGLRMICGYKIGVAG